MDYKAIEYASYASWPALEQVAMGEWVVRWADGYTKRANSVNVLGDTEEDLVGRIESCEEFYRQRGQASIFRLLSFCDNGRLDELLAERGYSILDPTLVLCRDLKERDFGPSCIRFKDVDSWMESFCRIYERDPSTQATHGRMLRLIEAKALAAVVLEVDNREVACGLGVVQGDYFGIFDIGTDKTVRKRGFGTQLLNGMMSWAVEKGASKAYVQVMAENAAAIRLYRKLGYEGGYDYWYRVKELGKGGCTK